MHAGSYACCIILVTNTTHKTNAAHSHVPSHTCQSLNKRERQKQRNKQLAHFLAMLSLLQPSMKRAAVPKKKKKKAQELTEANRTL